MTSELKIVSSDDFEVVCRRLELLAKSTTARELIDADLAREYQQLLTSRKSQMGQLDRRIEFAEKFILIIAEEHPEWFADKKTLSTPFGSVHSQKTTSHRAIDEAHSIRLIKAAAARTEDEVQKARLLNLIRTKEELNLEAIEALGEKELRQINVARIQGQSISIKIAKPAGAGRKRAKKQTTQGEKEKEEAAA